MEQVEGSIVIPEGVNWVTPVVRVIAVGPKVEQAEVGDLLLMSPSVTIHEIRFNQAKTFVVHEDGVFGQVDAEIGRAMFPDYFPAAQDAGPAPCCLKDTPAEPRDDDKVATAETEITRLDG